MSATFFRLMVRIFPSRSFSGPTVGRAPQGPRPIRALTTFRDRHGDGAGDTAGFRGQRRKPVVTFDKLFSLLALTAQNNTLPLLRVAVIDTSEGTRACGIRRLPPERVSQPPSPKRLPSPFPPPASSNAPLGRARPPPTLLEKLHRIDQGAVDPPEERDPDKAPGKRQFEHGGSAVLRVQANSRLR
jgi:hypothetical protein